MPNEEAIQKMSIVDPIQVNVNIPNFEGKPGKDGTNGRDGDDAYRIAVRNGFLGTEKEWLLTLKGQDGKSASAPTARQALLKANVWCEDDTVDSVFNAIIGNWGKPMPRTEFKPLVIPVNPVEGQQVIPVSGEPHYKVKLNTSDTVVQLSDNGSGSISLGRPFGEDDVNIVYLNYVDTVVDTKRVQGIPSGGTSDDTDTVNNIKYSLKGRVLTVNMSAVGNDDTNYASFLGKFKVSQVDSIVVKVDEAARIIIQGKHCVEDSTGAFGEDIPIFVNHPENLYIGNSDNLGHITIGTLDNGTKAIQLTMSEITWDDATHQFKLGGAAVDHL